MFAPYLKKNMSLQNKYWHNPSFFIKIILTFKTLCRDKNKLKFKLIVIHFQVKKYLQNNKINLRDSRGVAHHYISGTESENYFKRI